MYNFLGHFLEGSIILPPGPEEEQVALALPAIAAHHSQVADHQAAEGYHGVPRDDHEPARADHEPAKDDHEPALKVLFTALSSLS